MPSDDRFWCNDDDRFFPLWPNSTNNDPEELVDQPESGTRMPPVQHRELLPKHQVLPEKTLLPAKKPNERAEPKRK